MGRLVISRSPTLSAWLPRVVSITGGASFTTTSAVTVDTLRWKSEMTVSPMGTSTPLLISVAKPFIRTVTL